MFSTASSVEAPVFEIVPVESWIKFDVKASVDIAGKFDKWEASLIFTSPDETTGVLEIKIYADSVDTAKAGNFFYTRTQLTYSPLEWFTVGYVVQRTRAYQTPLDIQRGLLVGFTHKKVNFTTQIFNPGQADPTVVLSLGYEF